MNSLWLLFLVFFKLDFKKVPNLFVEGDVWLKWKEVEHLKNLKVGCIFRWGVAYWNLREEGGKIKAICCEVPRSAGSSL